MAERERRLTPPYGGVFVARSRVMDAEDMQRATWRMAHEVVERNHGLDGVVLIGLQTGGVPLAARLGEALERIEGVEVPVGSLDVAFYRDDIGLRPVLPEAVTDIPGDLDGRTVVLVDDGVGTGDSAIAVSFGIRIRCGFGQRARRSDPSPAALRRPAGPAAPRFFPRTPAASNRSTHRTPHPTVRGRPSGHRTTGCGPIQFSRRTLR